MRVLKASVDDGNHLGHNTRLKHVEVTNLSKVLTLQTMRSSTGAIDETLHCVLCGLVNASRVSS